MASAPLPSSFLRHSKYLLTALNPCRTAPNSADEVTWLCQLPVLNFSPEEGNSLITKIKDTSYWLLFSFPTWLSKNLPLVGFLICKASKRVFVLNSLAFVLRSCQEQCGICLISVNSQLQSGLLWITTSCHELLQLLV